LVKVFSSAAEAETRLAVGKIQLLVIDQKKIALARFADGFKAFNNSCPHQYEPLHKGMLTRYGEIVCPLHYYRFNGETGQEANNRCTPVETFPVVINEEGFFLKI
jgi:3-phenylpropionate/trans-cinnamate dioxygenase ferredoxin subunit